MTSVQKKKSWKNACLGENVLGVFLFYFRRQIVKFTGSSLSSKKQNAEKVGLCERDVCYEITKANYKQYKYYILYYIKKLHTNYEWSLLYTTM